ncbi:hypothetical protein [Paenibacillus glycanilyticus]|uniref:hypothetical protein n=1 Tax=Paenibacillus glycanilyticus TaxID=126569 RepID=UPI0019100573|nr:hypothetical protein [Paenibacillus glycanilyticus]
MKNKSITTKWTILLSSTVLAACLLSACNNNNSNANTNSSPSPTVSASPTPSESASPEVVTKQGKGEFIGLADSHTVEITVDGEAAAYQLGEGTDSAVAALKEGDNVSFEYTEAAIEGDATAKLLTITKIEKMQKSAEDMPAKELPATKDFKLQLEGNEETRTGTLAKGDGYALYIFEQFKFDAAANKLIMNVDNNYYLEISKLPEGFKLDDVKADAEKELKSVGEVQTMDPKDVNSMIGGVDLMVIGRSDKLTKEVIVKTVDGVSFLFKVNMPVGEPTEGFGPLAFTSMGSIVAQ